MGSGLVARSSFYRWRKRSTETRPRLKRTSEPWLGSLPYRPVPKVQAGSARLTSTQARHWQPQPASSQATLPRAGESTLLPQTGTRALRKHTELLVKKWAEPGPLAATQLGEGTTLPGPFKSRAKLHFPPPQDALIAGTSLPKTVRRS